MEPLVLAYMSSPGGYMQRLQQQLINAEIDFEFDFDEKFSWRRLVNWQRAKGDTHPDRLLIFVGGWDTLLMGTKEEIKALNWTSMITFAGDKMCWPDEKRIAEYVECGWQNMGPGRIGPWRYLNTGPTMGQGWLISEAVRWGMRECPLKADDRVVIGSESGTDMRFWTDIHLKSPFGTQIDYKCKLGQTALVEADGDFSLVNGRIKNNVHQTYPIFLHLNGKTIAPEGLN